MWPLIAMVGLSAMSSISSASAQQANAKIQNKLRKAQNTLLMISAYSSMGRVNENKIQAAQQSQGVARALQQEEFQTLGTAQVSAGAAGVRGRSVDQAFTNIVRAAGTKELQREEELRSAMNAYEAQMDNIWESGVNMRDIAPDASESFDTLGVATTVGMTALSAFNQRSTAFDRVTGTSGKLNAHSTGAATSAATGASTGTSTGFGSMFSSVGNLLRLR